MHVSQEQEPEDLMATASPKLDRCREKNVFQFFQSVLPLVSLILSHVVQKNAEIENQRQIWHANVKFVIVGKV